MIADFLKSRLWVIDWHHRHPEIGKMWSLIQCWSSASREPARRYSSICWPKTQDSAYRSHGRWLSRIPHRRPPRTTPILV